MTSTNVTRLIRRSSQQSIIISDFTDHSVLSFRSSITFKYNLDESYISMCLLHLLLLLLLLFEINERERQQTKNNQVAKIVSRNILLYALG